MNNGLKSGLVLLVLGIVCGTLLAVVNSLTAPTIQENELSAQYEALSEFYTITDYDLSEVEIGDDTVDKIYVLKQNDVIEALVYSVSVWGYSTDKPVNMLIAVNRDLSIQGYTVVSHGESSGFGADIVGNDFGVDSIIDLSGFDSVASVTITSNAIKGCFEVVQDRVSDDFGGGLND